jgi:hypothetical protein
MSAHLAYVHPATSSVGVRSTHEIESVVRHMAMANLARATGTGVSGIFRGWSLVASKGSTFRARGGAPA